MGIVWCDPMKEIDIFIGVELGHLAFRSRLCTLRKFLVSLTCGGGTGVREGHDGETYENLHLLVQPIIHHERVAHPYPRRLHRMSWSVISENRAATSWSEGRALVPD